MVQAADFSFSQDLSKAHRRQGEQPPVRGGHPELSATCSNSDWGVGQQPVQTPAVTARGAMPRDGRSTGADRGDGAASKTFQQSNSQSDVYTIQFGFATCSTSRRVGSRNVGKGSRKGPRFLPSSWTFRPFDLPTFRPSDLPTSDLPTFDLSDLPTSAPSTAAPAPRRGTAGWCPGGHHRYNQALIPMARVRLISRQVRHRRPEADGHPMAAPARGAVMASGARRGQ